MAEPQAARIRSLDGLRGIAALIVVFHHLLLTSAVWLEPALKGEHSGHLAWAITDTPLHIFWAGYSAVIVFFVLSGFVLSLPVAEGRLLDLWSYYPRRLIRLYLPAWAALFCAVLLRQLISHEPVRGATGYLNQHAHQPLTATVLIRDATFASGVPHFALNPVLWSLHWEIIFSLLLPLFVGVAAVSSRTAFTSIIAAITALGVMWFYRDDAMIYLPIFFLGSLLAFNVKWLVLLRDKMNTVGATTLTTASVLLLTFQWWSHPKWLASTTIHRATAHAIPEMVAIGAMLAVIAPLVIPKLDSLLSRRAPRWVGSRSYSLYLIHEPILIALGFALGGPGTLLLLAIGLPATLIAAELLWKLAERPATDVARKIGRYVSASRRPLRV